MTVPGPPPAICDGWLASLAISACDIEDEPRWFAEAKRWAFPVRLYCTYPSRWIPACSRWFVVLNATYPHCAVEIHPAVDGGITVTFPHQRHNGPSRRVPWRTGALCLTAPWTEGPARDRHSPPRDPHELLPWALARAHSWILHAATRSLLTIGDPRESPDFAARIIPDLGEIVVPGLSDPRTWLDQPTPTWGAATLHTSQITRGDRITVVHKLVGVETSPWGAHLRDLAGTRRSGAWLRLPVPPQLPPWQAPQTWGELRGWATSVGFDLEQALIGPITHLRGQSAAVLLLGYPIPSRIGWPFEQVAWQALRLPRLMTRRALPARARALDLAMLDRRGPLADSAALDWLDTTVWSRDRLAVRGVLDESLQSADIVLIGAGALGSQLAHLLIRGGVRRLHIIDGETIEAGNLVRHTATLCDLGVAKATALRDVLNAASPFAEVTATTHALPGDPTAAETVLGSADLIIDATAADEVLTTLARLPGVRPRRWLSLSLSRDAERLYCFSAAGTSFPESAFHAAHRPWRDDDAMRHPEPLPWAGAGCWSPVFPSRIDDIAALVGAAVREVERSMKQSLDTPAWVVLSRDSSPSPGCSAMDHAKFPIKRIEASDDSINRAS